MVVVSDTSPISALLQVGHLELLPKLFGRVVVPEKVLEELRGLRAFGVSLELLENAEWLNIQNAAPSVLLDTLLSTLDPGEAHAIALSVD